MAFDLSTISKTSMPQAIQFVVYGNAGVGKTTLASQAPKPIFIQTEDGAGNLQVDAFPLAESYDDVLGMLDALGQQDHDYKTVVIDSIDHLEPLVWEKICSERGWKDIEAPGYGKGYLAAMEYWRKILERLQGLREFKHMHVILIAHSIIKKYEDPEHSLGDRHELKLHQRASALITEVSDVVVFCMPKVAEKKEETGFGKVRSRGISTGRRVMATEGTPAHVAKNRFCLPAELDLSWSALHDAIYPPTKEQAANG